MNQDQLMEMLDIPITPELEYVHALGEADTILIKWIVNTDNTQEITLFLEGMQRNFIEYNKIVDTGHKCVVEWFNSMDNLNKLEKEFLKKVKPLLTG